MKCVVTGATSFIGCAVVKELLKRGHEVAAVVRPGSKNLGVLCELKKERGFSIISVNLEELGNISDTLSGRYDLFFHFGWDGAGSENRKNRAVQQKNVTDAYEALLGAKNLGCKRFLFSGSQAEYGVCRDAMTETHSLDPVSEYGKAKVAVYEKLERQCEIWRKKEETVAENMEYIHARIFSIYGPGDHPWSLVNSCLNTFSEGGHMELGACTQLWNFLYVEDLVEGLLALMFAPKLSHRIYNLAGSAPDTRPLRWYVEKMYELCGKKGSFTYGTLPPNAEGPANLIPDITRITEDTGWQPRVSFEAGIFKLLEQIKDNSR